MCRNHPYRDGDKRVAFIIMVVSLELNGLALRAEEAEVVTVILALADGKLSEKGLGTWLQEHVTKAKGRGAV